MTDDPRGERCDGVASEIEALLAVDASPDFRARVRAALDTPGFHAPWWRRLVPVTSVLAACAVLIVLGMWGWTLARDGALRALPAPEATRRAAANPTPQPQVDAPSAARPDTTDDGRESRVAVRRATPRAPASREAPEATPATLGLPDVVLAEDEVLGLKLLLMPPVTHVEKEADAEPAVRLADIELREIVLEPLAVVAWLEGELE